MSRSATSGTTAWDRLESRNDASARSALMRMWASVSTSSRRNAATAPDGSIRALSSNVLLMPRAATVRVCGSGSPSDRTSAAAPGAARRRASAYRARQRVAASVASVKRTSWASGARNPRRQASSSAAFTTGVDAPGEPAAMISLSARAPSSPPILAMAVTASSWAAPWSLDPTARTVSSSAGIARGSFSRPSANAAATWTADTESRSTGIRRSTAMPSPMRPAASAAWRRTPGFGWLNASRSGTPSNRRASDAASSAASTPTVASSVDGRWATSGATTPRRRKRRLETNRVSGGFEQLTHVLRKARKSLL